MWPRFHVRLVHAVVCVYVHSYTSSCLIYSTGTAVSVPLSTVTKKLDLAWLNKTQCSGYEKRLIDCPTSSEKQLCSGIAGVECANQKEGTA